MTSASSAAPRPWPRQPGRTPICAIHASSQTANPTGSSPEQASSDIAGRKSSSPATQSTHSSCVHPGKPGRSRNASWYASKNAPATFRRPCCDRDAWRERSLGQRARSGRAASHLRRTPERTRSARRAELPHRSAPQWPRPARDGSSGEQSASSARPASMPHRSSAVPMPLPRASGCTWPTMVARHASSEGSGRTAPAATRRPPSVNAPTVTPGAGGQVTAAARNASSAANGSPPSTRRQAAANAETAPISSEASRRQAAGEPGYGRQIYHW